MDQNVGDKSDDKYQNVGDKSDDKYQNEGDKSDDKYHENYRNFKESKVK